MAMSRKTDHIEAIELPTHFQVAIKQAIADNPDWTAEQFMAEIGAAVSDQDIRDAIEEDWLRTSIHAARAEQGKDLSVSEMRDHLKNVIDAVRAKQTGPK